MRPFQNETDVLRIGDLTLENRVDQVVFSGSLSLTLDVPGRTLALSLQQAVNAIVDRMHAEGSNLPEKITIKAPVAAGNLFGLPDPEAGH